MRGHPTDTVAGMVWAGEPVDAVADEYGLSRGEVLVACWYEGMHGQPRGAFRRAWHGWAQQAGLLMWRSTVDYATVPDPPCRDAAKSAGRKGGG
jgi:hypothetical protein